MVYGVVRHWRVTIEQSTKETTKSVFKIDEREYASITEIIERHKTTPLEHKTKNAEGTVTTQCFLLHAMDRGILLFADSLPSATVKAVSNWTSATVTEVSK